MSEKHEFQFSGVWLPAAMLRLITAGTINGKDMILLAMISGLEGEERGCFASNAYLGGLVNCTARSVQQTLARLEDLGLIERTMLDDRHREIRVAVRPTVEAVQKAKGAKFCTPPCKTLHPNTLTIKQPPKAPCGGNGGGDETTTNQPEESMQGFLTATTPARGVPVEPVDQQHAVALHQTISKHTPGTKFRCSTWAKQFALLRVDVGLERLDKALAWYATAIGGQYTPQAFSATTFRKKFPAIEAAMARAIAVAPLAIADLDVGLQRAAERLLAYGWPNGGERLVPKALQATHDSYVAFRKKFRAMLDALEAGDIDCGWGSGKGHRVALVGRLCLGYMPLSLQFAEGWMAAAHKKVRGWQDWDGNVMRLALADTTDSEFDRMGCGWSIRATGSSSTWTDLTEAMKQYEDQQD